jgi:predicted metal-dependent phosphoesterase TrpH
MPAGQPFTSLCRQMAQPRLTGRVDLHLHTTASDGSYRPAEIVDLARRSGLSALAITDHDTLQGIEAARLAAGKHLEVVAGVEVTAEYRGKEFHLLGFFVRPKDEALGKALARLRHDRVERFREMVERLRLLGVRLEEDVSASVAGTAALGRRHLAEMLVKAGRADTVRHAFQRYLSDRGRVSVAKRCLPVAEAVALVRGAGGVAAWAHPAPDCTRAALQELRGLGMQAVEVEYPSCRPRRRRELRRWAMELGMAISGGSDCHGPGLPHHAIGTCGISWEELEQLRKYAHDVS